MFLLQAFTLAWMIGLAGNLQAATPKYFYFSTEEPGSEAVAVNDSNQAVVNLNNRAYLWTLSGGLLDLGDPAGYAGSGNKSTGYAINNLGQIVGEYYIDGTNSSPFLWDPQTQVMTLLAPTPVGGVRNIAGSINKSGKVLGASLDASDQPLATWTWQAGVLQLLDLQGGVAFKIEDDLRMVGQKDHHAYLWTAAGVGQDLGTLPDPYTKAQAMDMNKKGQVVGWAKDPVSDIHHAFSWAKSGGIKDLGTLGGPNGRAFAINDSSYIVGFSDYTLDPFTAGCLWIPSGAKFNKFNLDTLVINKPEEVTIGDAYGINSKGVIVGRGNGDPATTAAYMLVPQSATVFAPKFAYSESWTEKTVKYKDPDLGYVYDVAYSGKFQIIVTIPAFVVNTANINADTQFSVDIGSFTGFSFFVGDDPKYTPSKHTATITQPGVDYFGKTVTALKATLKWDQKTVTITINGVAPNDYLWDTPLEINYNGVPGPISDTQAAVVNINILDAPYDQAFTVNITGKNTMKSVVTPDGTPWDLNNISVKGGASGF